MLVTVAEICGTGVGVGELVIGVDIGVTVGVGDTVKVGVGDTIVVAVGDDVGIVITVLGVDV